MRSTITILATTLILSCGHSKEKKTEDSITGTVGVDTTLVFDKLVGSWKTDDGKTIERWTKDQVGMYDLRTFNVSGSDTIADEEGKIYRDSGQWTFENKVRNENKGKSVKFSLTLLATDHFQFSNPEHDFPTDINYGFPGMNSIRAFIVGPDDKGGKDTIPFNYTRLK